METWVIANQKGGVGKTTSTITMGAILAGRGKRVLLVDLDPHGSLTAYLGHDPDTVNGSVYGLFQSAQDVRGLIHQTDIPNLSLMAASPALATLDRQLGAQKGGGVVIRRALLQLRAAYDYVLIDCPPTLGILMINALAAADFLIVPVQTEYLAIKGLDRMYSTLDMIARARNVPLSHLIVPTLYDRRTRAGRETLEILRERYGENLWDLVIPVDTQFRDASKQGKPLPVVNDQARGVLAFEALVDTVIEMRTYGESRRALEVVEA